MSLGSCAFLFVLAGCDDGGETALDAPSSEIAAALKHGTETPAGEDVPQRPALMAESVSTAASRDEITAADGRWTVSRTGNPEGAFVLVRNDSAASMEAAIVHLAHGDAGGDALGPRETKVLECAGDAVPLTLRTDDGTVIHDAPLDCGDALYVRRHAAASGSLR